MLLNPFTVREVRARGLLALGQPLEALRVLDRDNVGEPVAPQWQVIEQVTTGEVLAASGDRDGANEALLNAVATAEPHQLQRAIRAAERGGLAAAVDAGKAALQRLRGLLAPAA